MEGLAGSAERRPAERQVADSIFWTELRLRVLTSLKKKVLPLHCKRLDLHVTRMTT